MSKLTNDQVILKQILKKKLSEMDGELTESEYFEIYSTSEILKDYDISYDDVNYGIVGDGGDGGIDSIFTFLNGELVREDTEINANQKKNIIELKIIQSKISSGFSEVTITKFRDTADDLFNLSNDPQSYSKRYNQELIDRVSIFRNVFEKLAVNFPELKINYYYASQGEDAHPNVIGKVDVLRTAIKNLFSASEFEFTFIGAKDLLEITRKVPSTSRILEVSESPISTESGSYVCLVSLDKYYNFISDAGALARSIFEANVRDYQGSVVVNTAINKTLMNQDSEDFWYLNNGVTIISPNAVSAGKKITIEDPQIVNGLQTSHEVYSHFSKNDPPVSDDRNILVRIISEQDEGARDRIIRATNSQTSIPPASLRSSDQIHRNIEDFLSSNGLYYDRKKNFYKNMGKPVSKIISIPYMAQAMMAIVLKKPDSARARPSTLINSKTEYVKIFSLGIPIDVYLKVIQIMKSVERYLKPSNLNKDIARKEITNIKFYVAMLIGKSLSGSEDNISDGLAEISRIDIKNDVLEKSFKKVYDEYIALGGTDQVAKGPSLIQKLL